MMKSLVFASKAEAQNYKKTNQLVAYNCLTDAISDYGEMVEDGEFNAIEIIWRNPIVLQPDPLDRWQWTEEDLHETTDLTSSIVDISQIPF